MLGLDPLAIVIGLLLTPGPTNILLSLSAASVGALRSLPVLGAAIGGYISVIGPLASLAAFTSIGELVELNAGLRICAVVWLLWLAYQIWTSNDVDLSVFSGKRVFVTTIMNPKAFIVALMVESHEVSIPTVAVLVCSIGLTGAVWVAVGLVVRRRTTTILSQRYLRRVSSFCLAGFGVALAVSTLPSLD